MCFCVFWTSEDVLFSIYRVDVPTLGKICYVTPFAFKYKIQIVFLGDYGIICLCH